VTGRAERSQPRRADESGQVAGIEAVPLGFLVFVVGVLFVTNAWAVIDAKMTVASAAREAARAYVEAEGAGAALPAAEAAADEVVRAGGRDPNRLQLTSPSSAFARCQRVMFTAAYPVPAITLPWIGGFGHGFTARARHSELVDPYRSGVPLGADRCDTVAP
jgi:hypothetical protein